LICIGILQLVLLEENIMWKAIVAGTAALAIAGTTLVYAQQHGRTEREQRWQPNTEDFRAFGEARLAALKAGLTLTPEQEKNWPAFEQAARELGKLRLDRMSAARSAPPSDDPAERLRRRAAAMSDTGAALKKLADATDPLYKSLDEGQKRRFAALNRLTGHGREGREHHFRDRFGGREGEGGRGGWFHWGPRHTDDGPGQTEHPGTERL
jgi:zinc resistance-associated protein